jgi:hypothetical protein
MVMIQCGTVTPACRLSALGHAVISFPTNGSVRRQLSDLSSVNYLGTISRFLPLLCEIKHIDYAYLVMVIKSRSVELARHVENTEDTRNAYYFMKRLK